MPDIFVPHDTIGMTSYFRMAANQGLIIRYAFDYTDQNRNKLMEYKTGDELTDYLKKQNLLVNFSRWAEKKGLKRRNNMLITSKELFEIGIYGNIVYNMLGMEEYIKYLNHTDKTVIKAVEVLEKGESVPKAPENNPDTEKEKEA